MSMGVDIEAMASAANDLLNTVVIHKHVHMWEFLVFRTHKESMSNGGGQVELVWVVFPLVWLC